MFFLFAGDDVKSKIRSYIFVKCFDIKTKHQMKQFLLRENV